MPDNTFILKKLPNVSELSLIFITQIIVMNMLATIAIYNRQIKKFPTEKQNVSLKHILT